MRDARRQSWRLKKLFKKEKSLEKRI